MGFGGGGGAGAEEEWRVGDYPVGFIVIAVLLKNTETVCLAYSNAPPATEHIGPYTLAGLHLYAGVCWGVDLKSAHLTENWLI